MSSVLFSEDSQNLLQGDAEPHSADVQDQVKPQNEEPASETQTPNQNDENIEDEEFSERETDPLESPHKNVVVVRFSVKYIVTVDGFLKMAQVILSLVALVCLAASDTPQKNLFDLPLAWHLRVYIFILVSTMATSLVFIVVHSTSLIDMCNKCRWTPIEMVLYGLFFIPVSCWCILGSQQCRQVHAHGNRRPDAIYYRNDSVCGSWLCVHVCVWCYCSAELQTLEDSRTKNKISPSRRRGRGTHVKTTVFPLKINYTSVGEISL